MRKILSSLRQRNKAAYLLWLFPLGFLILFFVVPLIKILQVMFSHSGEIYISSVLRPVGFTFWQAGLSTFMTLLIGLPSAFIFARFQFFGKKVLRILTTLPFIMPTVVVAAGFSALLGPRGVLNSILMNLFNLENPPLVFLNTMAAIITAHVFYNTSIVIRIVGSAIVQMDPRIEQAAQVLGASPAKVIRNVTLPLLRPSILAAALMVFLFDFTSFGVILLLGGPTFATIETAIYTQALSMLNLPMAGVLSILQMVCTTVIMALYSKINSGRVVPLFPRLQNETEHLPNTRLGKAFIGLWSIFLVILQVFPLAALVVRSIYSGSEGSLVTFGFYRELFINRSGSIFFVHPARAAINSLIYAAITVFLSVSLGTLTALIQTKMKEAGKILNALIMLPLGTSAVTLGLGFLITFDRPPLDVKSFPLLIPIAHSLIAMPFVVRTVQPALASIPDSLRQAASVLGASNWRVWWHVEAPIIGKAVAVSAIFSFAMSLGEFGATTFLARPETPTLPLAIYRFISQPGAMNYGQAMAMSTLLMIVCALCIAFLDQIQQTSQSEIINES